MLLGAHWSYWVALAAAATLVALEMLRRRQHARVWLGAFLEQGNREDKHHLEYRPDQRVHAIQARLSRSIGKRRAFSAKTRARIERELRK